MSSDVQKKPPGALKFLFGGLAGMGGVFFIHPFDLVKTRMQISGAGSGQKEYRNSLHCIQTVISKEGFFGLYQGMSAALFRQATYTTARLGLYSYLNDWYKAYFQSNPNVTASMGLGIIAGAFGAFVGTPADLALIRMASDGRLPEAERRNYTNVFNAINRIIKEDGIIGLWRGSFPTVCRAMVVNMTQLASYTQFKNYFRHGPLQMDEGIAVHIAASAASGLLTTITSMPLDIAKTRIQNMKLVAGKPEYTGTLDVLSKVAKHEGIYALWKGFTPYFCRLAPHTVITFVLLEQLNHAYNKYILGDKGKGSSL